MATKKSGSKAVKKPKPSKGADQSGAPNPDTTSIATDIRK